MSAIDWQQHLLASIHNSPSVQPPDVVRRQLATRVPQACPTCNGIGSVACPGPSLEPKSQMQRDALGLVSGRDYCYGMHMGHDCPDCPTVAKLLAIGAAVMTAKKSSVSSWMHPEDREQALTRNEVIAYLRAVER